MYLSSFFRQLHSELAELNSTKTGRILESECDLKMRVQNFGYPLPQKIGAPESPFSTQLNARFKGLYLPSETSHL